MNFLLVAFLLCLTSTVGRARGFYCMKDIRNMNSSTPLEKLTQDMLCEIDSYRRPVRDPNKILYVTIKFQPVFFEIMEEDELFRIAGFMQMSWADEFLKWQPNKYGSITEFKTSYYNIWYPRITTYDTGTTYRFIDEMDRHRFEDVLIKSNGSIILRSVSNLYGPCNYDSEAWPFEEWNCVFTLARTSDDDNMIQTNPFNPLTNIDATTLDENKNWKIVSNPPFSLSNRLGGTIEISVTVQRHVSHYQNIFVFPGIALLTLSLISFWLTNRIYCRMILNMLTTLVELTFLQRMFLMLENNGSRGVALYNFYLDSMFTSFIGILFAVINAKLITRTTDPPQYMTEIIGILAVVPFFGPIFSYFVYEDINSPSAVEDDEVGLVTGMDRKESQKWRVISNFLDKCAFLLILFYFVVFYLLRILF